MLDYIQNQKLWCRVFLVLLSAGLGVLVFAPFSLSYLAFIAWLPLFVALHGVSIKVATRLGFLHGVCFFGGTMGWLANVFQGISWAVYPLVFVLAFFTAMFGLGYGVLQTRGKNGWRLAVLGATWWGGVEFIRSELFVLKFSWMTPGMGIEPQILTSVVGVYGMSVLIVTCALMLVVCRKPWVGLAGLSLLLCMSFVPRTYNSEHSLRVLALQAEFASLERYKELVESCEEKVDVILFPEYALEVDLARVDHVREELMRMAGEREAILIVGARTDLDNGEHYNSAVVLDEHGILGVHHKNNPVHFFNDGKKGEVAKPTVTSLGVIGSPICFDNDYEDVVRRMTASGAEVFLVPSLDAKHWGERQHYLHSEVFRHRAAESGRSFVVAAGSGVTQMISSTGERLASLPIMEEGVLRVDVPLLRENTVYSRYGWVFPWTCLAVSSGVLVYCLIRSAAEGSRKL
jgi:apolipoprotein N-acyltransferase